MLPAFTFTATLKKNVHEKMVWTIESEKKYILCIVDGDWDGTQMCFRGTRRPARRYM